MPSFGGDTAVGFEQVIGMVCRWSTQDAFDGLTHSFLTAKQLFPGFFFTFFYAIFTFLRPEHHCYAKL